MNGYDLCVIGSSWGGLQALDVILSALPPRLDLAIAIVQHRSPDAPDSGDMEEAKDVAQGAAQLERAPIGTDWEK